MNTPPNNHSSVEPTSPICSFYHQVFERSADAILIIEGDTFVDCNQATVDMLRYGSKQELLQSHPSELSPSHQPDGRASFEKANEMIALALEQGSHRFEWNHRRADGEVFPVEVLLTAVRDQTGDRVHVAWRDITERKRLEAELRQAQKMEAIGKLAGGVAHDFNNLLVAILGHGELLAESLAETPGLLAHVAEIRRAGERAADLVGQLLAFSRKQDLQPRVIEINELLADLMRLLERVIGERVTVVADLATDPLHVKADPGQLEQVVLNLAANARDAMPTGGTLTLRTRLADLAADDIGAESHLEPGRYVELSISDTGEGIAPALVDQIFEPFFTTKSQGKGTGLGLASVYGVIRQSGGDVTVSSEPNEGTVFRILLPHTTEQQPVIDHNEPDHRDPGGPETIMLVEDDDAVAALMERVLTRAGYEVIRFRNGKEALTQADEQSFDLLVTDVVMPQLGGIELAHELRSRRPDLPVLFISGYTNTALAGEVDAGETPDLLQKPFAPRELLRRVRNTLESSRRS